MLILIPVISNVIKEQKNNQYIQQTNTIKLAAKNFGSDNLVVLPTKAGEYIYIALGQLKMMGYMDQNVINPKTSEEFSDCVKVKITKNGGNYDYEYIQDSENMEGCSIENRIVAIGEPSYKYINNKKETKFLITIKNAIDENLFTSYTIQKDKIKLISSYTGDVIDAPFSIRESNGSFLVIIKGGNIEGKVRLKLENGAIIQNDSVDLIPNGGLQSNDEITIDNTAPTIIFGTNGNNNWSREVSSKITVTDSNSGGDETSYKYIYTKSSETPNKDFSNETAYTLDGVTGEYYLTAYACDNAGNCITETSDVFKLDNEAPSCGVWEGQNENWTTKDVTITMTGIDDKSGIKTGNKFIKTYSNGEYKQDTVSYQVEDTLGNSRECSSIVNVYFDKQAPNVPTITLSDEYKSDTWTNKNVTMYYSSTDGGVNGVYYQYSHNNSNYISSNTNNGFQKTNTSWEISWDSNYKYYIRACDNLDNCSESEMVIIKIDKKPPTITKIDVNNTCIPIDSYKLCASFEVKDSNSGLEKIYKSHCVESEGSAWHNSCYSQVTVDGKQYTLSARDRLNYFLANNNTLLVYQGVKEGKTVKENIPSDNILKAYNSFTASHVIEVALYACDSAGNCVNGDYRYNVNGFK